MENCKENTQNIFDVFKVFRFGCVLAFQSGYKWVFIVIFGKDNKCSKMLNICLK